MQSQGSQRRIVITIDSGDLDTDDLNRLMRLAHRLDAELEGVFVEDSDLLRLAGLSFLRELRPTSMRSEQVHPGRMEQELRAMARRAERALSEQARRQGISCRFRTWRGSVERELLNAMEADVLALMRLGTVMRQPPPRRAQEVVTTLFDGTEAAARALVTAAEVAAESDQIALQVLLPAAAESDAAALQKQAAELLPDPPGEVTYESLNITNLAELIDTLRRSGSSALVLQRDNRLLRDAPLRDYLARIQCPLFLVR